MLEQHRIACDQGRRGGTEHLPERKIPGRHRKHGAQRFAGHVAAAAVASARSTSSSLRPAIVLSVVPSAGLMDRNIMATSLHDGLGEVYVIVLSRIL